MIPQGLVNYFWAALAEWHASLPVGSYPMECRWSDRMHRIMDALNKRYPRSNYWTSVKTGPSYLRIED